MDLSISYLNEILFIIKNNFWQIFIIITLLRSKELKINGIVLLFSHLLLGYKPLVYIIVLIFLGVTILPDSES